jgi:cobalt-zinc-cadmium efflux system outer membrane protein
MALLCARLRCARPLPSIGAVWLALVSGATPVLAQRSGHNVPVTLRAVLEASVGQHPAMIGARARVRAAHGSRGTAGAWANPVFELQIENAALGNEPPPMEKETMATTMVPLEGLYQRGPRVRRADAGLRASLADTVAERRRVSLAAVHAYSRMALAQVVLEASDDLVAWLDTVAAYNRARVGEGVAAEADLLRAELERDRAAALAGLRSADLAVARAALTEFLGDSASITYLASTSFLVEVPVELLSFASSVPESSSLLDQLPTVLAARERLEAADAGISAEKSLLVPSVGGMIGFKWSAGTTSLMWGLSLPLPLFNWNGGAVTRAEGERDAAAADLAAERRSAAARLAEAREAARVLTDRLNRLVEPIPGGGVSYLRRADEARRIALGAYREGAVPLFTVIDAARAWGEARITFFEALLAQRESVLALRSLEGVDLLSIVPASPGGSGR